MWVERSPEEIAAWQTSAVNEARSHARLIAGLAWVGVSLLAAGGWIASTRAGIAIKLNTLGSFGVRFLIALLGMLPVSWFIFKRELKTELDKVQHRVICPKCDTASYGNPGDPCACGEEVVSQSTLKWIEDAPP